MKFLFVLELIFISFLFFSCSSCGGKGRAVGANAETPGPPKLSDLYAPGAKDNAGVAGGTKKGDHEVSIHDLQSMAKALEPLHGKMGEPLPGDWLDMHDEPGQSFLSYRASEPVVADEALTVIYILPLGSFTQGREKLVKLTVDFMEKWFGVPVKTMETLPLSVIPDEARRVHPDWGDKQILTGYVLHKILKPRLPDDALGCLALTSSDLWPGKGWNFVFGQASLSERVGVWSLYRKGNADATDKEFRLALKRTLQTATHEMGHMLGMYHCTDWECGMNGSNSLDESDRRPVHLCPECLKKLWWATGVDPASRFKALAEFCDAHGLDDEKEYYNKAMKVILDTH